MNRLPWWRDALGLLLSAGGVIAYITGVIITWATAGPGPALLVMGGLVLASAGVLLGRYDPDVAAARRAERVHRSVDGQGDQLAG